jgi:hypothetical protein
MSRSARRSLLLFASLLALFAGAGGLACSRGDDGAERAASPVVEVPHTNVKDQTIGNCWLYATAAWIEALHAPVGGKLDLSESYWTYWWWYLQIVASKGAPADAWTAYLDDITTGGWFHEAAYIVQTKGMMREADFIPEEARASRSARQAQAKEKMNRSLRDGALATAAARTDRALVRRELDRAWGLSAEVVARLDAVFGPDGDRPLASDPPADTKIQRAAQVQVETRDSVTHAKTTATVADVLPKVDAGALFYIWPPAEGITPGRLGWKDVEYPSRPADRRAFLRRMQRALHDGLPPMLVFYVDHGATREAAFVDVPKPQFRPGGSHMVVMSDYEVEGVPGFGTLAAGRLETRPEALAAALADEARITFLRVKNSWGETSSSVSPSGHYDLHVGYLDKPVEDCMVADGGTDPSRCWRGAALHSMTLPAGY